MTDMEERFSEKEFFRTFTGSAELAYWMNYDDCACDPDVDCGCPGEPFLHYRPLAGEFWVDGIHYRPTGGHCEVAMIKIYDDIGDANGASMVYSRPPTEQELDDWVHRRGSHAPRGRWDAR